MARWNFALLAALLGVALALPAHAQWKWRDSKGQTQYSDLPPPAAVPEQDILSRPNAAKRRGVEPGVLPTNFNASSAAPSASAPVGAASSALAPKTVEPELEAKRKKVEAEQAERVKAAEVKLAAARAENCTRAQGQARSIDSGIRLARTNEKGEREILDDKQRADESKRARDIIAADCK